MRFQRHQSALVLASVVTVALFVGATAYTQHRLFTLDALSSTIETNAAPSIQSLARSGAHLRRLRQMLINAVSSPILRPAALKGAREELNALEVDTSRFLKLTPLAGEQQLWDGLRDDVHRAISVADSVLDAAETGDIPAAQEALWSKIEAFDRADEAMLAALEFDVGESERLAREVRGVRRATTAEIAILDAFATAVATFAAFIAYRASRDHDRLMRSHNRLLTERVAELDRFSGRVAHDILSPLGVVGMGLALIEPSVDSAGRSYVSRSQRALQRVQELVDGLLAFARSGAQPGADARCAIDEVLANVVTDATEAARAAGIDLVLEPSDHVEVACRVGVMTSIAQNLVRNAIKYMGDAPVKRVTVRAIAAGETVRLEVEDTGPGISAKLQNDLFQPFVRGDHEHIGGIGLGLATVKRLVEGHGGKVGVNSQEGTGALFWVELPRMSRESGRRVAI